MHRVESARYDWPFQPWPGRGNTLGGWDDEAADTGTVVLRKWARRRSLLLLVPLLLVALAGAAAARWFVDDSHSGASPESSLGSPASPDQRLTALLLEHRRAARGM